jgi:hypothetical protein
LEEARTNLILRSEEFDDASWTKASATITANESTAPDGTTTADLWTNTGSTGTVNQSYTKDATARTYSASIWVKSSVTSFKLALDSGSNTNRGQAVFNFETGVLTTIDNIGTFTNTSGTITAYPDSWYRVTVTTTTSTATTVRFIVFFSGTGETARIWGAQLEENAAFATSYIPTTTATVTRAADISTSVATSVFESSWYNATSSSVYAEVQRSSAVSVNTSVASLSDGTLNNTVRQRLDSNGTTATWLGVTSGVVDGVVQVTAGTAGLPLRMAGAAELNSYQLAANGALGTQDTSALIPSVDRFEIGAAGGIALFNGHIRRLTYWPTRLGNEVLQRITQ